MSAPHETPYFPFPLLAGKTSGAFGVLSPMARTLPNSSLMRVPVTIVSRKHRRLIPFHLPYGCNPAHVVEAVGNALSGSPINGVCVAPPFRARRAHRNAICHWQPW